MSICLKLIQQTTTNLVVRSMTTTIRLRSLFSLNINNKLVMPIISLTSNLCECFHCHQIDNNYLHNHLNHLPSALNVFSSDPVILSKSSSQQDHGNENDPTKASEEQLTLMSKRLTCQLPEFFKKPHDFRIYNRNIVFEDNIRNVRVEGLNAYAWQIAKIKMGAHIKYAKATFNILKITQHVEDSTIKIRWRIVTYPGNKIIFAFWKFKLWSIQESLEKYKNDWIDGFSIFYIGGDGLIHKHVCDKVMPDTNEMKSNKTELASKLEMA